MTPGNRVGGSLDRTLATLDYRDQPPMMNRPDVRLLFCGHREPWLRSTKS